MNQSSLKIAIIGYGKMGKTVERIAAERGHKTIVIMNLEKETGKLAGQDVSIEFTEAAVAAKNLRLCIDANVPVVSGTTGWNADLKSVTEYCVNKGGAMLHSSNFSIGVNIFFKVNSLLAKLMNGRNDYEVAIEETHHTEKKDAPSGTAITTALGIIAASDYKAWKLAENANENPNEIPIIAHRIAGAHGDHLVTYTSKTDTLSLRHEAHSRDGFALGAVLAAEFLVGKTGIFTMEHVLENS